MATFVQLLEVKDYLQMTSDYTKDDAELQRFIDAGCRSVERYKGRVFGPEQFEEYVELEGTARELRLNHGPIISVESVEDDNGLWLPEDFKVRKVFKKLVAEQDKYFEGDVEVAYTAGMEDIPEDWKHATIVFIKHLWDTQRRSSITPRNSGEDTFNPSQFYSLPGRVKELLGARVVAIA